jgi:hypothetical protein
MISLSKLFVDLFDKPEFSNNEILDFSTDHAAKFKKDDSGKYTAHIAATDQKLTTFKDASQSESGSSTVKKSNTSTKVSAKQELLDFIRIKEGVVKDIFRKQPAVVIEFYPQGLAEFNKCKIGDWPKLAKRYLDTANKYKTKLGNDFITEATTLVTNLTDGRKDQVDSIADHNADAKAITTARKALTLQLSANVYAIASNNVGNGDAATLYFNESLLYNVGKKKTKTDSGGK